MSNGLVPVRFAIVKFVPDPIRDEPINVGVVGVTEDGTETRFLDSLSRLKSVLEDDDVKALSVAIKFLRSSLERSPKSLEQLNEELYGQVRLSTLMGGVAEDPATFLDDQFEIYVASSPTIKKAQMGENKTKIRDRIRKAIGGVGRQSEFFSLKKARVKGAVARHGFDFGAINGHPTLIQAISFQTSEEYALNEAKLLAWATRDTKRVHDDVEIAAVIAPPRQQSDVYDEALRALSSEDTRIVNSATVELDSFVEGLMTPDVRPIPNDWLEVPAVTPA